MTVRQAPRDISNPLPGFWMIRLVKNGPEVPACIVREATAHEPGDPSNVMERPAHLVAYVAGDPVEPSAVWETRGREITESEYRYQLADLKWRKQYEPRHVESTAAINLATEPSPF